MFTLAVKTARELDARDRRGAWPPPTTAEPPEQRLDLLAVQLAELLLEERVHAARRRRDVRDALRDVRPGGLTLPHLARVRPVHDHQTVPTTTSTQVRER